MHYCAGAFIKDELILTAARCLDRRQNSTDFKIVTTSKNGKQNSYKVEKYHINISPDWYKKPSYLKGDLATIKVSRLTRKSADIATINLPTLKYYPNAYFDNCTLLGWPRQEIKGKLGDPRQASVNVISMGECYNIYNTYAETAHKICTRNDYNQQCPASFEY